MLFVLHCKADIMEKRHRDLLTSNQVFLVTNLDLREHIDHMKQTRLIDDDYHEGLMVT